MKTQRPGHGAPVPDERTRKFATVGKLAAGIAHEINSPMQYIDNNISFLGNAFADLLRLQKRYRAALEAGRAGVPEAEWRAIEAEERAIDPAWLEAEIPRAIDQSREGVGQVAKIALALKDFSHPALHDQVMSDINRGIQNTVEISRHEWKYFADLDMMLDPDLPLVRCSIDEINQAVLNLIVNAAQAIREKITAGGYDRGRITVTSRPDGNGVIVSVADDGPGIPPGVQPRLFEPFFTTKPAGIGSGQGLAIARNAVEILHGGRLDVSSEPGRTMFTIRLPLQRRREGETAP